MDTHATSISDPTGLCSECRWLYRACPMSTAGLVTIAAEGTQTMQLGNKQCFSKASHADQSEPDAGNLLFLQGGETPRGFP